MPSLLVICVNYYNEEQTIAFARRIIELHSPSVCHVAIASNNISGGGTDALRREFSAFPQVTVMHWGKNLGYYGAACRALDQYRSKHELPDWVAVSNTDLLLEAGPFDGPLNRYARVPGIGVIAPSVTSTVTGIDQNPFMDRRPAALRMHLIKWMFKTRPTLAVWLAAFRVKSLIRRWLRRGTVSVSVAADLVARPIYAPHGSFIAFSREYFARGGTLNHAPFLYGEELMVAETARRLGLAVLYDPKLKLKHVEHSTTGISAAARIYRAASASYCADTYFPLVKNHAHGNHT